MADTGICEQRPAGRNEYARCGMAKYQCTAGESGDLFGNAVIPAPNWLIAPRAAPELKTARVLCRQLRQKQARPDKLRIAHLICLNLLSMLRRDALRG